MIFIWYLCVLYVIVYSICSLCLTYGLLTKREVNMAGYWPSSFFCVFMDRDEINTQKKNETNIQPS